MSEVKFSHRWDVDREYQLPEAVIGGGFCGVAGLPVALDAAGGLHWLESGALVEADSDGGFACDARACAPWAVVGGDQGRVTLWQPGESSPLRTMKAGKGWVERVRISPDGNKVAAACGKSLVVWDASSGEELLRFDGHPATVLELAWRPDSAGIASSCYGGVRLFKLGADDKPPQLLDWQGSLISLAWSPNARYVAAGSQENSIRFWKLPFRAGEELQMTGYASKVANVSWDASARWLASGGGDTVTNWDVSGKGPAGSEPGVLEAHEARICALVYHPSLPLLASGDVTGELYIWGFPSNETIVFESESEAEITTLNWADNAVVRLLVGDRNGGVKIIHGQ